MPEVFRICDKRKDMIEKNDVIGRFLVERKIDTGGMSEIFEVKDKSLNARWAMKSIELSDKAKIKAAVTEVEILKSVSHPSIPRIADMFEDENKLYIFMDYIDGINLKSMADRVGGLTEKDTVKIGVKLALVLSYLHGKGIIYRDLKPSNVMITNEGYVRLTDFGIAARKGEDNFGKFMYATKEYAPYEILNGEVGDERSDIYELGATLSYICRGKRSKGFKTFCKKCMRKKPKERFSDAKEAALFLKNIDSYNKEAKKNLLASIFWIVIATILLIVYFTTFGVKAKASGIIELPGPAGYFKDTAVYANDIEFNVDLSAFENVTNAEVYAEGATVTQTNGNSYILSGEGNIRIKVIIVCNEDSEKREEFSERIIIDKTPPVVNYSFSDRCNPDGSLSQRSLHFSFSDLCVDYQSLLVMINEERVNFDIPEEGAVDFTLDFDGTGDFSGYISVRDAVGHEGVANIDTFFLNNGVNEVTENETSFENDIEDKNEIPDIKSANEETNGSLVDASKQKNPQKSDESAAIKENTDEKDSYISKEEKEEQLENAANDDVIEKKIQNEETYTVKELRNEETYTDKETTKKEFYVKEKENERSLSEFERKIVLAFSVLFYTFGAMRMVKECKK